MLHVLEDVRLKIAVDYENGESCDVFEGIFVCLEDMLHTFEWMLGCKDLMDICIDFLDSIDVNLVGRTGRL